MSDHGLYAVTPDWDDTARLLAITEELLRGGVARLQYRHKSASPALRREQAGALRELAARYRVPLLINDDVELARELAVGAHLGRDDGDIAAARAALGPHALLGASCYGDFDRAIAALAAGADHVAFGAMYPSPTKPLAPTAPHSLLGRARRELGVPVACIGGITLANAAPLIQHGASFVAVISDLFTAPDPFARARRYIGLFARHYQDSLDD